MKGIFAELKASDYISIVTTIVLTATLIYVAFSAREQARVTQFLVTPNLGAKWDIKSEGDGIRWDLLVTNYSTFPVYIKRLVLDFPKLDGFPKVVLGGHFHIPPGKTERVRTFYMTQELWSKRGGGQWPVRIFVLTSVGSLWEVEFRTLAYDELEFVSIRSASLKEIKKQHEK